MIMRFCRKGSQTVRIEDLYWSFQDMIPLALKLTPSSIRFEEFGGTKKIDSSSDENARYRRLERGQTCTLFVLSAASLALVERHNSYVENLPLSQYDEETVGTLEDTLLRFIENGSRRGILSFKQFLLLRNGDEGSQSKPSKSPSITGGNLRQENSNTSRSDDSAVSGVQTSTDPLDAPSFNLLASRVVTDLLFEFAEPIIGNEALAVLSSTFFSSAANIKLVGMYEENRDPRVSGTESFIFLDILRYNLKNVCIECARALEAYTDNGDIVNSDRRYNDSVFDGYTSSRLLSNLAGFFSRTLKFRIYCLEQELLNLYAATQAESMTGNQSPKMSVGLSAGTTSFPPTAPSLSLDLRGSVRKSQEAPRFEVRNESEKTDSIGVKKNNDAVPRGGAVQLTAIEMRRTITTLTKFAMKSDCSNMKIIRKSTRPAAYRLRNLEFRDFPLSCGIPLPMGEEGVLGSQRHAEFWLLKIRDHHEHVDFRFKGNNNLVNSVSLNIVKSDKGQRDKERERFRKLRKGVRDIDTYISSDEEEEDTLGSGEKFSSPLRANRRSRS